MSSRGRLLLAVVLTLCFVPTGRTTAGVLTGDGPTVVDPLTVLRDPVDLLTVEQREEIRLVAARGGVASAPVVVMGTPQDAAVSALNGPDGAVLPAETLRVRYAILDSPYQALPGAVQPWLPDAGAMLPYYDVLQDRPDPEAEMTPVWVTAAVPRDQPAGRYTGHVEVDGHAVPLVLDVAAWRAPRPADWTTCMNLVTSPETLARHYGVELWSEEHMALVRRQLEFAAALGNDMVNIPVYHRNEFAPRPWVFFHRDGEGYRVDFEAVDRYLDLYEEVLGEPRFVLLNVWDERMTEGNMRRVRERYESEVATIEVATTDESGEPAAMAVPMPQEPGSEEVFGPLLEGMLKRLEQRGWPQDALMLGVPTDQRPTERQLEFFSELYPAARWLSISHARAERDVRQGDGRMSTGGMEVGLFAHPYSAVPSGERLAGGVVGGWDLRPPRATTFRVFMYHTAGLDQYRSFPSGSVASVRGRAGYYLTSSSGMTHIPLDFWEDEDGRSLLGRHNHRAWQRPFHRRNTFWLVAPGPDGPVSTARFEMLREGFLEVEARVKLESALAYDLIGGELAERVRALLRERAAVLWLDGEFGRGHRQQWQKGGYHDYGVADGWQDSTLELFNLAAEVAEATGRPRYFERM